MFTARGIERVAAVLLLAVFLGVVVVLITGPGPLETSRDEIRATLLEIEADSGLFATSAAFLIFVNLITIPLAAALYIVFRSHDQPLALFGSFGFLTIGILHVALGAMLFSFQALARDFVDAGGAQQADAVVASVRTITPMLEILFPAGSMGIALGVIAYGALLVRTAALPRWVGWVGIVAGIILPLGWLSFVNENLQILGLIGLVVSLVFVVALGSWLLVKGTERTAHDPLVVYPPEVRGA